MSEKVICFFNSSKSWGGGEKWHFDIATRLILKDYKVVVITNKESELYHKLQDYNIKIYPVKISNFSFLNPVKINKIRNILKYEGVTTLIINLPSDLKVGAYAAKKANVRKVIYRRGSAIPLKNKMFNRIIFKNFIDEIIANSLETKNTILQNNEQMFDVNKINLIYNGLDISSNKKSDEDFRYERIDNEIIIGNAGRFVKQKNHIFLIRLANELKNRGLNFKLLLAGDGKLKPVIEKLAKDNNLNNEIIFTGFIHNIKSFMNSIDLYIQPSLWEGFGYVLVEAMFYKKPVIAFNLSSNPEIIDDEKTGYLVEPNNLDDFVSKILLIAENNSLRKELGDNGEQRVLQRFTIDRTIEEVEKILI